MMAAPILPEGLTIHLENEIASLPYLKMTWALMQQAGINGEFSNRTIFIPNQTYNPGVLFVESDWSAASYFYGMVALAEKPSGLFLSGLKKSSLQGDAVIQHFAKNWGIDTRFEENGAWIERKTLTKPDLLKQDFLGCPDLGQTLIVICALSGTESEFSGLQSLAIKETNRLLAIQKELSKISVVIHTDVSKGTCRIPGNQKIHIQNPIFDTYGDHRMAMALSMISSISPVRIRNPEVVRKSFPGFWKAISQCGFDWSFQDD
jgi:3-phosphoshikimate 1-carboxyvinyltransferase